LDLSSSLIHWNPIFIRAAHNWKQESLNYFLRLLYSLKTHLGEVDSMLWIQASSHGFAVKSYYKMLQLGEHCSSPWKSIWKVKAPPHIAFFLWTAAKGRIITIDNLRRRGFSLANWCCLYKKNEQTINHLLVHCEYITGLCIWFSTYSGFLG